MKTPGIVMLNDEEIGTFEIDDEDRVSFQFYKGAAGIEESLEYAAEQGFRIGLQLKPDYEETP